MTEIWPLLSMSKGMLVNADKPHLWKNDVTASIDLYND